MAGIGKEGWICWINYQLKDSINKMMQQDALLLPSAEEAVTADMVGPLVILSTMRISEGG